MPHITNDSGVSPKLYAKVDDSGKKYKKCGMINSEEHRKNLARK